MHARTTTAKREEPAVRVVIRHPVRLWRYHLAEDYDWRTTRRRPSPWPSAMRAATIAVFATCR
jgi:hypothetical protein